MVQDTHTIHLKRQVWRGIYETDRVKRYYGKLSDRMQRWHDCLTWTTVLCAAMAIIPLAIDLPTLISVGFFGAVAASTLWSIHAKYASKATAARIFAERYSDLAVQWRQLWYGDTSLPDVANLWSQYNSITSGHEISEDEGLNAKAQQEADDDISSEFRAASGNQELASPTTT